MSPSDYEAIQAQQEKMQAVTRMIGDKQKKLKDVQTWFLMTREEDRALILSLLEVEDVETAMMATKLADGAKRNIRILRQVKGWM